MSKLLFVSVVVLCISFYGIESGRNISSQLRAEQTIQPKIEREFDCMDIYKQPAFDNVLLNNHQIQMSPSSMPKSKRYGTLSSLALFPDFEDDQTERCPQGMVPIQRSKVNQEQKELRKSQAKLHQETNFHQLTKEKPGRHFAAMYTKDSSVFGARAIINLQNPAVKMNQVSMSEIWIGNGQPSELNIIQVGWAVNPRLYGDNRTRVTAYWTRDGSQKTGCYNTMCPGFVQVHPSFHLGQVYPQTSVIDGAQYETQPSVYQDRDSGNWWLMFDDKIKVGYWPKELFTHLNNGIGLVQFGGWTYISPDGLSPPMGSGRLPDNNYKRSCYFANVEILNEFYVFEPAQGLQKFVDVSGCFDVKYDGNQGGKLGQTFTFGGPGGNCGF